MVLGIFRVIFRFFLDWFYVLVVFEVIKAVCLVFWLGEYGGFVFMFIGRLCYVLF